MDANYDFFSNDHFKKHPYAFFVYLKTCKSRDNIRLLAEVQPIKQGVIRSVECAAATRLSGLGEGTDEPMERAAGMARAGMR